MQRASVPALTFENPRTRQQQHGEFQTAAD